MPTHTLAKLQAELDKVYLIKDPYIVEVMAASVISHFISSDPCWIVIVAPSGGAKCLGRGTLILMYNGATKLVEDVVAGDLVMGDDSTPRKVLSTNQGEEELFRIKQSRGDGYVVNKSHILSLKQNNTAVTYKNFKRFSTLDIPLDQYLKKSQTFKKTFKGYRVPVDFRPIPITLDPYFLGVWLGDGRRSYPSITTMDPEIADFLYSFASLNRLKVSTKSYGKKAQEYLIVNKKRSRSVPNPILVKLKSYGLSPKKFIPREYKINSRTIRLEVLAGLIDTDGTLLRSGGLNRSIENKGFGFVSKDKVLAEDVVFLSRSLGLHASIKQFKVRLPESSKKDGIYWRVYIGGDIEIIPTRIKRKIPHARKRVTNSLLSSFTTCSLGQGKYYGFTLDGNGRFLLGDFTVTHNSEFINLLHMIKWTPPPPEGREPEEQMVHALSTLTSKTFISGAKITGRDTSLLLQISNGIITFKDLTSLLSENPDERRLIMAQLREIYDGKYSKSFGTGETLEWIGKITIVAGATFAIHQMKAAYTAMGERFIFYNMEQPERKQASKRSMENQEEGQMTKHRLRLAGNFNEFELDILNNMPVDLAKIDPSLQSELIDLAELATRARSDVQRNWASREQEITGVNPPEMPTRFAGQLQTIARSLMIIAHHETGEIKLLPRHPKILFKLALDSIVKERREAMIELTKYDTITTSGLATKMGLPTNSVRRRLEDLTALDIAAREKGGGAKGDRWIIKQEYRELIMKYEGVKHEGKELLDTEEGADSLPIEEPADVTIESITAEFEKPPEQSQIL